MKMKINVLQEQPEKRGKYLLIGDSVLCIIFFCGLHILHRFGMNMFYCLMMSASQRRYRFLFEIIPSLDNEAERYRSIA